MRFAATCVALSWCFGLAAADAAARQLDLAAIEAGPGLLRLYGSAGEGYNGVAVAGPADADGDGNADVIMSAMLADPGGRTDAGILYLHFGTGRVGGGVDTAVRSAAVLEIHGSTIRETAGNEVWLDDVTGDGIADLLIGRQNYNPDAGRIGAGALSIVVGGPALRQRAATLQPLELDAPSAGIVVTTLVGTQAYGRVGIWMRTGDVDGDGRADLAVGADQELVNGAKHAGAVYVVRGGGHLAGGGHLDLTAPGSGTLTGHVGRVTAPLRASHFHFGATCLLADLDGNGRAEVLAAAALNRAGATLVPAGGIPSEVHAIGGSDNGSLFIAWDDNFPAGAWDVAQSFRIDQSPGTRSVLHGADFNEKFGEEILGGLDYDADGRSDLFAGDIVGDASPAQNRFAAGTAHVFYDAAALRGRTIDLELPPSDLRWVTFQGAASDDIAGDTAAHGDFDGDGHDDLALAAPHATPLGRDSAGAVFVFFGGSAWPAYIDLAAVPPTLAVVEIQGARGSMGDDIGDTLAYSGNAGDFDGDGRDDLVINEMVGNGLAPSAIDTGNLLVLDGRLLAGVPTDTPCPPRPRLDCRTTPAGRSTLNLRAGTTAATNRLAWGWSHGAATSAADFGNPVSETTSYALCLYDDSAQGQPRLSMRLPTQADCAGDPCWRQAGEGFRFRSDDGLPDGARRGDLRPGENGRSSIKARARGAGIDVPEGLTLPVTAQWVRTDDGAAPCWGAEYLEAVRHESGRFIARGP